MGRIRLSDTDLDATLQQIAALARRMIPGTAGVAMTLLNDGAPATAAFTDDVALRLDLAQYEADRGPCLDAARRGGTNITRDLETDPRWPEFATQAVQHGIRSSVSIGLPVRALHTGALNLYGRERDAFDEDAVALARTFADHAAVAIANVHLFEATRQLADQMTAAMDSRAVIEQAKGVLVAQQHLGPDEAFALLSAASQRSNRKLRDIAQAVVQGAAVPPETQNPF